MTVVSRNREAPRPSILTLVILYFIFFIKVCGEALYLRAVLSVPCWEGTQLVYFYAVGIPMLLLYVVGLPLAVLVAVWRDDSRKDDQT
jgi:hypothetical protein